MRKREEDCFLCGLLCSAGMEQKTTRVSSLPEHSSKQQLGKNARLCMIVTWTEIYDKMSHCFYGR